MDTKKNPRQNGHFMDMNKTFFLKPEEHAPKWRVIDAKGKILGRLATELADILRGKDKPLFTPHTDGGDYIIVVNAEKIKLTGNKWNTKVYDRYTGFIGGYRTRTAQEMRETRPEEIITLAVKRMLPKNRLSKDIIKKLKVYAGASHPHKAQLA